MVAVLGDHGHDSYLRVVDLACRAPSVHDTQPWSWWVGPDRLELYADRSRQLATADPSGRGLVVSLGAALDHARTAARALGLAAAVERFPDPDRPDLVASLRLSPGPRSTRAAEDLQLIHERRTDRRRFTSWPVPSDQLRDLAAAGHDSGTGVVALHDGADRLRVALLLSRATSVQDADPAYAAEQATWSGDLVVPEEVTAADALMVLTTPGDVPSDWLRAGEALSALWLRATGLGLAVVPLTPVLEVAETRSALALQVCAGRGVPQAVLRVAWQPLSRSALASSPRRPLDDVLLPRSAQDAGAV